MIRGHITLECSSKGCHAEEVIDAEDLAPERSKRGTGVNVIAHADGWVVDDDGEVHCPQCCEEGRERGDDDGREYANPRDAQEERL